MKVKITHTPFFTSLSSKVAYLAIALVAFTAITVALLQYYKHTSEWKAHESARLQADLQRVGEYISHRVETSRRQILSIARSQAVADLISVTMTNRADADGAASLPGAGRLATLKGQLQDMFATLVRSEPDILQVRIISAADGGREVVRVDDMNGSAMVIEDAALQSKGGRRYVDETLRAAPGSVLFFGVDLNREHRKIELPIRPVLRVTTPLHAPDGTLFGMAVINLNMLPIMHHAEDYFSQNRLLYLTNEKGDYLINPDETKIFGFDFGHPYRIQDDFPVLAPFFANKSPATSDFTVDSEQGEALLSFAKIPFDRTQPSRYFLAAAVSPLAPLLAEDSNTRIQIFLISALLIVIGALLAMGVARLTTRPLKDLTLAAQTLSDGALRHDLKAARRRHDEVGALARSFHDMAVRLRQRQESLEEKEANIRAILETTLNPIILINGRGVIQDANPATTALFGYAKEELIGSNVSMLMTDEHRKTHDAYLQAYQATGEAKIIGIGREVEARRNDGTTIYIHLSVSELHLKNSRKLYVGVLTDLTERLKIDKMKDEFVSTVSHELRTPLTSIKGSLGLLNSSVLGDLPDQAKTMIGIAYSNCERLVRLINDILDIEKIAAGKLTFAFQKTEIAPFLMRTLEANQAFAEEADISLEIGTVPAGLSIEADPDRLAQVLTNLLSNAIKFSPKSGTVTLTAEQIDDRVRISVIDRGNGIPVSFRDKVFEKFSQADSSDTKQRGGSGLGLAITKEIVEAHGGEIAFTTATGRGTTFYFDLPLVQTADRPARSDEVAVARNHARILICEDDHDTGMLLRLIVRSMGWDAKVCGTAAEAKAMLAREPFAAMTLDLALPDQDGISLIRELRDNPATENLPILVVSAHTEDGQADLKGSAFSIIDWLAKPINVKHLREGVRRAVNAKHSDVLRILHIEDDDDHRNIVATLVSEDAEIDYARNCEEARDYLSERAYDLVILDLVLPDGGGECLLPLIHANGPSSPQILVFSTRELPDTFAPSVDKAMVKSQTSNEALRRQIQQLLGNSTRETENPSDDPCFPVS